jgi:hypothetical protein
MARIFICYRREDTSGYAGRLRDALSARFGAHEIFRDIDTIAPGEDFVAAMTGGIAKCRVFLVLIGRRWLRRERPGEHGVEDETDYVRREITAALEQNVKVIPVLVEGASMPAPAELPGPIRALAARNAIALDDEGWDSDVDRLVAAIAAAIDEPARHRPQWFAVKRTHAIALAAAALAVAIGSAVLVRKTPVAGPQPSAPAGSSASAVGRRRAPAGASEPAPPAASSAVTLPRGGEAEVGESTVQILEASRGQHTDETFLTLRVRLTNRGRYDTLLSTGIFRLLTGDQSTAPSNDLSDIVASETSKEGTLTFPVPAAASEGTLQITQGEERADVPLDFSGRRGLTAADDLEARRSGKATTAADVNPTTARMRFADLTCQVRSAVIRRYANKLTLTLKMRAINRGRYAVEFGDSHFRVLVDEDTARAPVSGVSVVVDGQADRDADIVFDLPLGTTQVVLRGRYNEATADLTLAWPAR